MDDSIYEPPWTIEEDDGSLSADAAIIRVLVLRKNFQVASLLQFVKVQEDGEENFILCHHFGKS